MHDATDHFIHEFYNFAISPYDIVGYDRNVDYSSREQHNVATVEISSNESSDGEVEVIDNRFAGSSNIVTQNSLENRTEVVLETTGCQETSCVINDMVAGDIDENVPQASSEVVVESSDSECRFVLALKPPHLRTPEQVSLDSASDSDVVFIPNEENHQTNTIFSFESDDTEDNKPLSETRRLLKSEIDEGHIKINVDEKGEELGGNDKSDANRLFNYGASTSTASQPDDNVTNQKKFYYHPIRKRLSAKSISDSSSNNSTTSGSSNEEWKSKQSKLNRATSKNRRKPSKHFKKRRVSSTTVIPKPLSELPSSEEAREGDGISEFPRVKSVIIKKYDDQHYIQNNSNSDLSVD